MARRGGYGAGGSYGGPSKGWIVAAGVVALAVLAGVVVWMARDDDRTSGGAEATTTTLPAGPEDEGTPGIDSMLLAWPKTEDGVLNAVGHWAPLVFTLNEDQGAVVIRRLALPGSVAEDLSRWPAGMKSELDGPGRVFGEMVTSPLAATAVLDGDEARVQMLIEVTIPGTQDTPGVGKQVAWSRIVTVHEWVLSWVDGRWWVDAIEGTEFAAPRPPDGPFTSEVLHSLVGWRAMRGGYAGDLLIPQDEPPQLFEIVDVDEED